MFGGLSSEASYYIALRLLHGLAIKLFYDYTGSPTSSHLCVTQFKKIERRIYTYLVSLKKSRKPNLKKLEYYVRLCRNTSFLTSHVENHLYRDAVFNLFGGYQLLLNKMTYNLPSHRNYPVLCEDISVQVIKGMLLHELLVAPTTPPEHHVENVKKSLSILVG